MRVEEMVDFCAWIVGIDVADFLGELATIDHRDPVAVAALRPCPLAVAALHARRPSGITVARTFHGSATTRIVRVTCPVAHILVTTPLVDADVSIAHDDQCLNAGILSVGSVCAGGPSGTLTLTARTPCDLLHLAVPEDLLRRLRTCRADFSGVVVSDPLIGRIARLLGEAPSAWLRVYADLLSQLLIARVFQVMPATVSPLPGWRLERVLAFVDANLDAPLRLADLAAVAGLSRMYFAGQFRAATGLKPHEFVLDRRIAQSKRSMTDGAATLVEIALDAGFQSQAHFCTIFKRLTGTTPSDWRRKAAVVAANSQTDGGQTPAVHRRHPVKFRFHSGAVPAANHVA